MKITAAELNRKLYIYSIFTDFKYFSLNRNADEYSSSVKGIIEMESKDEEIKIIFSWMAISDTKTYEDAFDFDINISMFNGGSILEIEGGTLVDENGIALNKSETTDALISFLLEYTQWQSKIRSVLPTATTF